MMLVFARIFLGSKLLQAAAAAVVALGVFKVWQIRERKVGARVALEKVERKANDDTRKADDVRSDVAAGKSSGRMRSAYERKDDAGQ